jgi:hypothetical protein
MVLNRYNISKLGFLCAAVTLFASCQFNGITGSGHVTTENRSIQNEFKSIEAGKGLDIVLEQSNNTSVTVVADDNLQKHISTKVENGVLIISSDYNSYRNVKMKKVLVQMPFIERIHIKSGAKLDSRNTIKSPSISIESSSGATITIHIETEKAICEASSGSSITINGKAINLETASSSGGTIDAEKLLSNDIRASASSGSNIDLYPLVSLKADASSGGNIHYHNIPKNLNKKSSSGGNITKE